MKYIVLIVCVALMGCGATEDKYYMPTADVVYHLCNITKYIDKCDGIAKADLFFVIKIHKDNRSGEILLEDKSASIPFLIEDNQRIIVKNSIRPIYFKYEEGITGTSDKPIKVETISVRRFKDNGYSKMAPLLIGVKSDDEAYKQVREMGTEVRIGTGIPNPY